MDPSEYNPYQAPEVTVEVAPRYQRTGKRPPDVKTWHVFIILLATLAACLWGAVITGIWFVTNSADDTAGALVLFSLVLVLLACPVHACWLAHRVASWQAWNSYRPVSYLMMAFIAVGLLALDVFFFVLGIFITGGVIGALMRLVE